jgi:ABC-type multidrug transport system ATPase subunit
VTPVLAAEEVHKQYGRRRVLRGASFEGRAGQLVAILGENGSGKSTLLRILAGSENMDAGRVRCRARLGYCPQDSVLYPYLTIDEHLELFARAYGLEDAVARSRAESLVERFGLRRHRRDVVEHLSGGTRQKLNLALAVLHRPDVVLLDEPYSGLDIESYRAFVAWTDDARREGTCLVLVTHLVFERDRFDAIYAMREGRLHVDRA